MRNSYRGHEFGPSGRAELVARRMHSPVDDDDPELRQDCLQRVHRSQCRISDRVPQNLHVLPPGTTFLVVDEHGEKKRWPPQHHIE
ncbi:MAG: hypothetical protein DMG01_18455 [Acidobacteria bacterium]|nr:MAG: hypothetical protein DMG01_18455 [Acidobacteriota bacterium]